MEKRPFFRAATSGLGKYHTGGYGRIGVYRVKLTVMARVSARAIIILAELSPPVLIGNRHIFETQRLIFQQVEISFCNEILCHINVIYIIEKLVT